MTIEKVTNQNTTVAVIRSDARVITDVQSALDLIMSAKYDAGTKNIVIAKELIT